MQLSLQFYTFSFSNSLHKQLFCLVFQQILFRGSFLCSSFPQSLFIESFSSNFIKALRNSFLNTYIPSFLLIEFTNSFSDTHSGTGLVSGLFACLKLSCPFLFPIGWLLLVRTNQRPSYKSPLVSCQTGTAISLTLNLVKL